MHSEIVLAMRMRFAYPKLRPIMSVKYQIHEAHDLSYRVHFVLSRNPYLGNRQIQFEVIDQDIILKGSVRSYYQKQMAQESLRKVQGIRRILNELDVLTR